MSLEAARELVNDRSMHLGLWTDNDDRRGVLTAQLLVELIDEVRMLRNDIQKLNQNS